MTYTFACPVPCSRVIRVDACDDDDAVRKIIEAGGMTCRSRESSKPCRTPHPPMSPLPDKQMVDLVRVSMTVDDLPEAAVRDQTVRRAYGVKGGIGSPGSRKPQKGGSMARSVPDSSGPMRGRTCFFSRALS